MDPIDEKLWSLLGASSRPIPGPFFTARVMRGIKKTESKAADWFVPVLRWLAPATVAALLAAALLPRTSNEDSDSFSGAYEISPLDIVQIVSPEDYLVLTSLDWPDDIDHSGAGL